MTATVRALGVGAEAGLYYVNDPNREARPQNRDDYYVSDGGGVWWTSGQTIVADGAPVDKGSFQDLCAGFHPANGASLVRGAGPNHRAGWDVTFSAPKSLGLLWASGNESERADLEQLHQESVDAALQFIRSEQLLEVRLGAGGKDRQNPTDLIVGRFEHHTSRAGDPNLHTHCVFLNVAGSADYRHRTLETQSLYAWQLTIGAAYRAELSRRLVDRGFKLRPAGREQIEIAGVDEAVIECFSKRSREIEELIGDRATASAARKQMAALSTRRSKSELPTGAALEARWKVEFGAVLQTIWQDARDAGVTRGDGHAKNGRLRSLDDAAPPSDGPGLDPTPVQGEGPVARAASKLLGHESVVVRRELLRRSLIEASRLGIGIADVERELQDLQSSGRLLTLRDGREAAWTTNHIAMAEAAMLSACLRADEREFFTPGAVSAALEAASHLSGEQQSAVIEATSRDGVSLIEAGAGTGKTTLATAIRDAADRSGLRVVGLAPTWIAADELAKSIGIKTQAVAKWRWDREKAANQTNALKLDRKTVLLIDETGMLGTLDLAAILTAAKAAGAKVVALGDRRQLPSVAQGSALSAMAEQLDRISTLKTVRRQEVAWQRMASTAMFEGRIGEGLAAYHQHGCITFVPGPQAAVARTLAAWTQLRQTHGQAVPIITKRNRDVVLLNNAARQVLRREKLLQGDDVSLIAIDRQNKIGVVSLAVGDQIRFGANLPKFGIRNGTRGTLTSLTISTSTSDTHINVLLEDGREIRCAWTELAVTLRGKALIPRVSHAYAGTHFSVQGRTAESAVFYIGQRTDARETYVAMTRHRKEVAVIVDETRLLSEADQHGEISSASEEQKLAALQAEAERFDEKINVQAARALSPAVARPRNLGLEL